MKQYTFRLSLPADEILRLYRGEVRKLVVRSEQGLVLELSADKLRPFVNQSGVYGRFLLKTQDDHRFLSLERLS
ncbi:DUF2835 domain-containing protein [Aeromonas schubertii]|uniref:DUF2835 domain-containing protein n=1 Tax=Aeromonas schubertii TaxID=652 RepID=A0A0S2SEA7_9GAMM|nr:DUF2835 domain-containing protein [Aeromonas schubertii]ALP40037.1 hypothetical protein WL1483_618 [Aeromonas schubertii]KUE79032.1 hypothetical protein ATO46_06945 [Aeromonas schubertii]MBZ6065788.1 DUF2835 domain-containing protein [Aeromonas schubertii]QCG48214.1 DUF2835 family protein [Aeromonas schubertii]